MRRKPLTREEKHKLTELFKELGLMPAYSGGVNFVTMHIDSQLIVNAVKVTETVEYR